jgi:hypothetical protein
MKTMADSQTAQKSPDFTPNVPLETKAERATQRTDLDTQSERGGLQGTTSARQLSIELIGLAAMVVASIVMYLLFFVHPVAHEPLNVFLTTIFGRGNAAIWPMQLVWYASAVAMIGLAFWSSRRASQLICLLAAAYFAWVGIVFFGVIDSDMGVLDGVIKLAWLWAAIFILEALLFLVAGIVRRDLVFAPLWNLSSVLGALIMFYALVAYPIIGLLSGHPLHALPMFGLAPCPTTIFFFGLLLWAQPPAPKYLLLLPLAWALEATPGNIAMGHAADFGMALVGVITVGLIIWRDRTSSWQTVVGGVLLAVMIAFTSHDDLMIGTALILTAVTLVQTIRGDTELDAEFPIRGLDRRRIHQRCGATIALIPQQPKEPGESSPAV